MYAVINNSNKNYCSMLGYAQREISYYITLNITLLSQFCLTLFFIINVQTIICILSL